MEPNKNTKFIEYYPLVDSLRAISVIGVIIYHLDINFFGYQFFGGGYLGVDIFFFISGYLITGLIYNEYDKTGKFNFLNFYNRRLIRIVPPIIFLLFILVIFQYIFYLPHELVQVSKIIISNLFFFSNIYFHYNSFLYWADNSGTNPLLHTWSLAIEEQYYLIFPIFFYLLIKFFDKKFFLKILILIGLISLLLANYLSLFHYNFSFYMIISRVFEFLLGSIIFLKKNKIYKFLLRKNLFSQSTGLFIIIFSFVFFNNSMMHPSALTLIPLLGSILILLGKKNIFLNKFLTSFIIISIGLLSYSLYLWHYPIITFLKYFYIKKNIWFYIYFLFFLLLLSLFSYYFIEKLRNLKKIKFNNLIFTTIFFYLIILMSSITFIFKLGLPNRVPHQVLSTIETKAYKLSQNEKLCHNRRSEFCFFHNTQSINSVIFFGDSVAGRLAENIKSDILMRNFNFIPSTYGGCNFYHNFNLLNKRDYKTRGCSLEFQNNRFETIIKNPRSILVLAGNFQRDFEESNFDNEEGGVVTTPFDLFFQYQNKIVHNKRDRLELLKNGFRENVLDLLDRGHFIVLVYPIPEPGWNVARKIYQNYSFDDINKNISTSYEVFKKRTESTYKLFDSIDHPMLFKIYPERLFCNNLLDDRCIIYNNKINYFSDEVHPSLAGSKLINNLIVGKIEYIYKNYLE
jgi:peptidoglycan/LPS O-acetylase OafA/YrhL